MPKLIAVRAQDDPEGEVVLTGYVARSKNRKRVWTFSTKGMEKAVILEKVAELEDKRAKEDRE